MTIDKNTKTRIAKEIMTAICLAIISVPVLFQYLYKYNITHAAIIAGIFIGGVNNTYYRIFLLSLVVFIIVNIQGDFALSFDISYSEKWIFIAFIFLASIIVSLKQKSHKLDISISAYLFTILNSLIYTYHQINNANIQSLEEIAAIVCVYFCFGVILASVFNLIVTRKSNLKL